ncbi:MAG: hypothetical protein ATN31_04080 [Candidatus Epulonipiscioides saccharophilum]|nr:MAG: hypothetical protein ATN31_04080 [Epulopiscium sp. AS2M-Bin001]
MVIGVDGGNSKTDYFLFTNEGKMISHIRDGTCSHERLKDSFDGSLRIIKEQVDKLLKESEVSYKDLEVGVFGLAGVDTVSQKEAIEERLLKLGIKKIIITNDGFLGIKAVSESGVCSINGTGTVTVGIDPKGNQLQVGGIGDIVGDDAGGAFITRLIIRYAYSSVFRGEKKTKFTQEVLKLLGCEKDQTYLLDSISELYKKPVIHLSYIELLIKYAQIGDVVALKIVEHVTKETANSVVGCMNNLNFDPKDCDKVTVILAGSVWAKPKSDILRDAFKKHVNELTNMKIEYVTLIVPPGIGAVLWALEEQRGKCLDVALKDKIIKEMEIIYGS